MKNDYEVRGDVTAIFLKRKDGSIIETLIGTSDLPRMDTLNNSWYAHYSPRRKIYYVIGNQENGGRNGLKVYAHRFLTDAPKGMVVDHINHDTLDNRRENMRVTTQALNLQNLKGAKSHNRTSGIRGVSWYKNYNKWVAYYNVNGKRKNIGYFEDIKDAERAVKEARAKHMPFSQEALAN